MLPTISGTVLGAGLKIKKKLSRQFATSSEHLVASSKILVAK